jgi:hypothetical protein
MFLQSQKTYHAFDESYSTNLVVDYSVFLQTQSSMFSKEDVVDTLRSDPALLHAALAHAALHLCRLSSERSDADFFYHGGQSIRFLNNRIKCSNIAADLLTTIGTITALTNIEVHARPFIYLSISIYISNFMCISRL